MPWLDILTSLGIAFLVAEKAREMPLIKYLLKFKIFEKLTGCYLCLSFWSGWVVTIATGCLDWRLPFVSAALMWIIVEGYNSIDKS